MRVFSTIFQSFSAFFHLPNLLKYAVSISFQPLLEPKQNHTIGIEPKIFQLIKPCYSKLLHSIYRRQISNACITFSESTPDILSINLFLSSLISHCFLILCIVSTVNISLFVGTANIAYSS